MSSEGGAVFRSDIQGLRALAVGSVLLYHAGVPRVTGGYIGVDIFFVISGFLITSHLMRSLIERGRVQWGEFYARRLRRVLPAAVVVAALTAVAAAALYPPLAVERVMRDALASVLYVPNIWFADRQTDYLADHSPSPYQHYWSLGVEEQFYLLWPLLLWVIWKVARGRKWVVAGCIVTLILLSVGGGGLLMNVDQPAAFFLLPWRAWELLIGATIAVALSRGRLNLPPAITAVGGWFGIAMLALSVLGFTAATPFPGTAALLPTVGTALVILCGSSPSKFGPGYLLALRPIQFVGLISYSLYLVHWPLLMVTQAVIGEQSPLSWPVKVLVGIVVAIPVAWLLYRFVEMPARKAPVLVRSRSRRTIAAALVVTAIAASGAQAAVTWASTRDIGTGPAVAVAPSTPRAEPAGTGFVPRNLTPSLPEVAGDLPLLYANDCHLSAQDTVLKPCVYNAPFASASVVVFGDSHAAQWFPAVESYAAHRGGVNLETHTKSSCPAVDVTVTMSGLPYAACDTWREAVVEELLANRPDLVVVSSSAYYGLADGSSGSEADETWAAGLARIVSLLTQNGTRVLVVADTPVLPAEPVTCVSANIFSTDVCGTSRDTGLNPTRAAAEARAVAASGGTYVDLTSFVCGRDACPVIIDNMMVYRDANHLTATFVRYLAPALTATLDQLLLDAS